MYQTPLTIAETVQDIDRKRYLLPSIQREFVWTTTQIERLFDSLMLDYPISTFLFWDVSKEQSQEFQFYEFLRVYHVKDNRHNMKVDVKGNEGFKAVLDGQQRLTALYIGLKGSYAYKLPMKRYDDPRSYPTRHLYLNLLAPSPDSELTYHFDFLTDEESQYFDETTFWFRVGEILNYKELYNISQYLIDNEIFSGKYSREQQNFANQALSTLNEVVHKKGTISHYLEKSDSPDKVLNIFIRINSGGTQLSYSDLLLSIATAQWDKRDAREEVTHFLDAINQIGDGFNFNKDFVLKSCLVLSDFSDIAFKVENFTKSNMLKIEERWDAITQALRLAVDLVASFGYGQETLTSNNAIIPIAYYLLQKGLPEHFDVSTHTIQDRTIIRKWLTRSLLKRIFSGQSDNVLRQIRSIITKNHSAFPFDSIADYFKGTSKNLAFTDEEIENLISYKYGQSHTFSALALLYPSLDFRHRFHIDHIYPRSLFTKSTLKRRGIPEDHIDQYIDAVNYMGNLQLLEGIPNIEKQDKKFDEWLGDICQTDMELGDYKNRHLIPDTELNFENFLEFFKEREKLLFDQFKKILQ